MNFRPKSFTIPLPPRSFYSNGRTTYRLPDSPGNKFAYLDGHLFKLLVDELVITPHADGATIFGAVQVQVIGHKSKANIMHHNAHLRTLPKRPSGQADGARNGQAAAQDGMADNPLAQAIFHGAGQASFVYAPYELGMLAGGAVLVAGLISFPLGMLALAEALLPPVALSRYRNPQAFDAAAVVLRDFLFGSAHRYRTYGPNSIDTQNLMRSEGIHQIVHRIAANCSPTNVAGNTGTGSWEALRYIPHDLMESPIGGQVGGDLVHWHRRDGILYLQIENIAGANSFFFHAVPDVPEGYNAPFNSIHQEYYMRLPDPCAAR